MAWITLPLRYRQRSADPVVSPRRVDSGRGQNRTLRSLSAFWPPVFAGEQDAGQELGLDSQPDVFPLSDRFSEMGGIPVNDDGGEQVEPSRAAVLALA